MNSIDALKSSESASFRKMNPHLFNPKADAMFNAPTFVSVPGLGGGITEMKKPKAKKRIRQSGAPLLNKLEQQWFDHIGHCGITDVKPQAIKLRIARSAFYKPDFFCLRTKEAWEVKGMKGKNIDRGKLALKVAATAWPEIKFYLVWKDEQGQWQEQHILP